MSRFSESLTLRQLIALCCSDPSHPNYERGWSEFYHRYNVFIFNQVRKNCLKWNAKRLDLQQLPAVEVRRRARRQDDPGDGGVLRRRVQETVAIESPPLFVFIVNISFTIKLVNRENALSGYPVHFMRLDCLPAF